MHRATKLPELPALTRDFLQQSGLLMDNVFASLWQQVGMKTLLSRTGFKKRSGAPIHEVIYVLVLWVWLAKESIAMFARDSVQSSLGKDVLYDTLNREDLNWRRCHSQVAQKAVRALMSAGPKALVLDDSIQQRFGKKMPGVSSHFDHTTGRPVMGQQVLTLGLSCEAGFVPLDSELYISQTRAQPLTQPFQDGRSIVAKRYASAQQQTKPEMAKAMIHRALRTGIQADYLLADAWFGSKAMIRLSQEASLVAVLRMKKSKLKYRLREYRGEAVINRDLDVQALYKHVVRKHWRPIAGQPYQAKVVDVEINLAEPDKQPEQWTPVRLLFVRGTARTDKTQAGKKDWAVFLCTDTALTATQILELYAMRWAIEVYFKEAKQQLGFLKEQSNRYAAYVASIHLTAMRFCLLVIAKQVHGAASVAGMRQQLRANSADIHYAAKLWHVFRAVLSGALDELTAVLGDAITTLVLETIDAHIHCWFKQALQLDPKTLRLEAL
jgi:SRSO17 transposase